MSRCRIASALRSLGHTCVNRSPADRSIVALLHAGYLTAPDLSCRGDSKPAGQLLLCQGRHQWDRHPWQHRGLFGGPDATAKKYQERKLIKFSQKQLYDVVADIEQYKHFVPWCQRSVITSREGPTEMHAELEVGFRMFVERYTSQVILQEPGQVISRVSDSTLFDHLDTTWEFQPGPTPTTCWLNFKTDFKFRSPLYGQVASVFFDEVVKRMIGAFEGRCTKLYGKAGDAQAAAAAKGKKYQMA